MTHATQLRLLRTSIVRLHDGHPFLTAHPPSAQATSVVVLAASMARHLRPRRQLRFSSTSSASPLATKQRTTPTMASLSPTALSISPSAANPPETTRPPPLDLPRRDAAKSYFSYLFAIGKAYLTFYKTGLKNLYGNARLVYAQSAATSLPQDEPLSPSDRARPSPHPVSSPAGSTRAHFLLRARTNHDLRRLPLFALLLLVCGEFTPLVALALPRIVPLTCRVPAQEKLLLREVETRRTASFARLRDDARRGEDAGRGEIEVHAARSLGLVGKIWDRVGFVPHFLARPRVAARLVFLARDDALLRQAGGVPALVAPEVVLACADRGLDVLGKSDEQLRHLLGRWLRLTKGDDDTETWRRMMALLGRQVEEWPAS